MFQLYVPAAERVLVMVTESSEFAPNSTYTESDKLSFIVPSDISYYGNQC